MQLEEVLGFVKQLSLVDKVRLIERVAPEIERDLKTTQTIMPKRSLWGICADLGNAPSAAEIDHTRQEVWANFPRDDF
jgi:phosphopentomutase